MTNLSDTGESVPAYYTDHILYERRPTNTSGREKKEIRTYGLLDSPQISYARVNHGALPTIEACHEAGQLLGTEIHRNLFLRNAQKANFYLLLMPGSKKFRTAIPSEQIGSARLSFRKTGSMEPFLGITSGLVSVMGPMNDRENRVRLLIDKNILEGEHLACHSCIDTSNLRLRTSGLMERALPTLGHPHTVVSLSYAE